MTTLCQHCGEEITEGRNGWWFHRNKRGVWDRRCDLGYLAEPAPSPVEESAEQHSTTVALNATSGGLIASDNETLRRDGEAETLRERVGLAVEAWRRSTVGDHAFVTTIIDMIHDEGKYEVAPTGTTAKAKALQELTEQKQMSPFALTDDAGMIWYAGYRFAMERVAALLAKQEQS